MSTPAFPADDPHTASAPSGAGAALVELAGLLLSTDTFQDLLQGVSELSVRTVGPAATCGITLSHAGRVTTVASADALANLLDEQQYERDEGPCLQALSTGEVVLADDLAVEHRWDDYPAFALGHGIASVLSTPFVVAGAPVGVLNLYARAPHVFDAGARRLAHLLAGQAMLATTAALRHYDEVSLSENLRSALSSRSVIDQAVGIVMARQRCDAAEAFAALRTISQRRNAKLRVVASELVAAVGRAEAGPPAARPRGR